MADLVPKALSSSFEGVLAIYGQEVELNSTYPSSSFAHKLVKRPSSWIATYLNSGHECLVVRISQSVMDPLSNPPWEAARNRHIGQRNIHVMTDAEAAAKPTIGIEVGPTFGQQAQVAVERASTDTMPWLHLVTNSRTNILANAKITGDVGITAPVVVGTQLPNLGQGDPRGSGMIGDSYTVNGDGMKVDFVATDGDPGQGHAHVYRISTAQIGQTFVVVTLLSSLANYIV